MVVMRLELALAVEIVLVDGALNTYVGVERVVDVTGSSDVEM